MLIYNILSQLYTEFHFWLLNKTIFLRKGNYKHKNRNKSKEEKYIHVTVIYKVGKNDQFFCFQREREKGQISLIWLQIQPNIYIYIYIYFKMYTINWSRERGKISLIWLQIQPNILKWKKFKYNTLGVPLKIQLYGYLIKKYNSILWAKIHMTKI